MKFRTSRKHPKRFLSFISTLLILTIAGLAFLKITAKADTILGFNEGTGTAVHDSSGTLSGTITNAVWKNADYCIKDNCLYFDGSGDYVAFADADALDFTASDNMTLVVWFRHLGSAPSANQYLLAKYNVDAGYKLYMDTSGHIVFGVDDDSTWDPDGVVTSTGSYADSRWHVAVAVKTGTSRMDLYIDGRPDGTPAASISGIGTLANSRSLYIGIDGDGATGSWNGYLDEVQIIRSAKTSSQTKNLSVLPAGTSRGVSASFGKSGQTEFTDGLVGYWKMDETSANSCTGGVNDTCDYSSTANDGAWTGNATVGIGKYGSGVTLDGTGDYIEVNDVPL